jgi:hypothetical protein
MARTTTLTLACAALVFLSPADAADFSAPLAKRAAQAHALLDDAESRFQPPNESWFHQTQEALREEVAQVGLALDTMDPSEAADWKAHLHWELLKANLHSMSTNLAELQLVRRWLYSNRKGLEDPLFAELRRRMDAHLDAAFTFSYDDLQAAYAEHAALARRQCLALADDPSDAHAAALGRTLGWLERTGQLPDEVAQIRILLSLPNAQIVVSTAFVQRVLQLFESEIEQTIPLNSTETAPPSGILRRERTLYVRGTAHSVGSTSLEVIANAEEAELSLVFRGQVVAYCSADAGPAALYVRTAGPVEAFKPIYLNTEGLRLGETTVDSQVRTHLQSVSARGNFVRRVAQRRANEPAARSHMHHSGHDRTTQLLEENLNERVEAGIAEIKAEFDRVQQAMGGFSDVLAPIVREGAVPRVQGFRSSAAGVELNVAGARRNQFGASVPYENGAAGADVQLRVHISMFNNLAETILGGKRLSDEFLMKYAQLLQAELPLPLMVHARSARWAITTHNHRPLELSLPAPNRLEFVMRIDAVEIDGQTYDVPTTATMDYDLVKNEFGEYALVRDGQVKFDTALPTAARDFLHEKLDAFFAPVLDAGGVAIPDGGVLGTLNGVQPAGVRAEADWITIGMNVPDEVLQSLLQYQRAAGNPTTWYGPRWRDAVFANLYAVSTVHLGLKCFFPL